MPRITLPTIRLRGNPPVRPSAITGLEIAHYTIHHPDGRKDHGLVPVPVAKGWEDAGVLQHPGSIHRGRGRSDAQRDASSLGLAWLRLKYEVGDIVTFLVAPELAQRWANVGAGERFRNLFLDYHRSLGTLAEAERRIAELTS